jgi:CheY-like chemotaxis protein
LSAFSLSAEVPVIAVTTTYDITQMVHQYLSLGLRTFVRKPLDTKQVSSPHCAPHAQHLWQAVRTIIPISIMHARPASALMMPL